MITLHEYISIAYINVCAIWEIPKSKKQKSYHSKVPIKSMEKYLTLIRILMEYENSYLLRIHLEIKI